MTNSKTTVAELETYIKFLNDRRLKSEKSWLMVSSEITAPASILTIDVNVSSFSSYIFVQTKLRTDFDLDGYRRLHKAYEANRVMHECVSGDFSPITAYYARKTWMLLDLVYNLGPTDDGTVNVTIGQAFYFDPLEIEKLRNTFTQDNWLC